MKSIALICSLHILANGWNFRFLLGAKKMFWRPKLTIEIFCKYVFFIYRIRKVKIYKICFVVVFSLNIRYVGTSIYIYIIVMYLTNVWFTQCWLKLNGSWFDSMSVYSVALGVVAARLKVLDPFEILIRSQMISNAIFTIIIE